MQLSELKAEVYRLAGVDNPRQLKAGYPPLASLNLRLKASWEKAFAFLKSNPQSRSAPPKTLSALKAEVYSLAQVTTLKQLKAKIPALKPLNFSRKASWEQAVAQLQQPSFKDWLSQPPDEYKALFADIESAATHLNQALNKAQRLGQEAEDMATHLEEQAIEAQEEAAHLKQSLEAAHRLAQQAELN